MTVLDEVTGARLTMRRRLRWDETDAAGHNHFSSAVRWLEESEHALWRELGLVDYVPRVPRVHLEIDYRARVWFDQPLEVTVGVIRVGETSCTFAFSTVVVGGEPDDPAASREVSSEGRVVVVHAPDPRGGAQPWPDDVRSLLESDRALVSN
jgi:acyl-CoA thioester hydrolase